MRIAFLFVCSLIVGTQCFATVTSQLQMEANAILNCGWWNMYDPRLNISNRCNWNDISCNDDRSIKAINIDYYQAMVAWGGQFPTLNLSTFNLSTFRNLESLVLREIGLQGTIPKEIGHLSKLTHLDLSHNYLNGPVPPELWLLKNLTFLDLSYNRFRGEIHFSLGNLKQLEKLNISNNYIEGYIPFELGFLKNLTTLNLSNNRFKGEIPSSIENLKQLWGLDISHNNLGSIPHELGFLKNLTFLDLSNNRFKGEIPSSLGNLKQLQQLNISHNNIQGSIPHELGFLKNLSSLDLSHNRLNGNLPTFLTNLTDYEISIDFSHNIISGEIPSELGYFQQLILSNNNLTGTIPQSLCNFFFVDISYNCLEGPIPNCLQVYTKNKGNNNLNGAIPQSLCNLSVMSFHQFHPWPTHKKNKKLKHIVFTVLPILVVLVLVFSLLKCLNLHHISTKKLNESSTTTKNGDMFCIWNYDGKIAYDDIIKATEDFDMRYCIGTGAYGSVYKAQLPCGKVVALKKLHGYEAEVPSFDESFRNEVRILSEIKHRHIVKLYGFCLHKRIMFLIYQYMERGSLFSVLYDDVEAIEFKWRKRVNTVKGVAFGLSYLHHDCTAPIVHRDVSTSNILLNSEWLTLALLDSFNMIHPIEL